MGHLRALFVDHIDPQAGDPWMTSFERWTTLPRRTYDRRRTMPSLWLRTRLEEERTYLLRTGYTP